VPPKPVRRLTSGWVALFAGLLVVALLALGFEAIGPLTPLFYRATPIAANGGVVELRVIPVPEGPIGPHFRRTPTTSFERRLDLIDASIPDPLPPPLPQWFCSQGRDVVVTLGNGHRLTYGPCYLPASIETLAWKAISPLR